MGQRPEELGDLADEERSRRAIDPTQSPAASRSPLRILSDARRSRRRELTSTCLQHSTVDALWFLPDAPQHIDPTGSGNTATLASGLPSKVPRSCSTPAKGGVNRR